MDEETLRGVPLPAIWAVQRSHKAAGNVRGVATTSGSYWPPVVSSRTNGAPLTSRTVPMPETLSEMPVIT